MDENSQAPSPADLAGEVGALVAGLGVLTIQLFPFAMPLIVLVIGPLAVLALAGLLLALPILLPLWLVRRVMPALRRGPSPCRSATTAVASSRSETATALAPDKRGDVGCHKLDLAGLVSERPEVHAPAAGLPVARQQLSTMRRGAHTDPPTQLFRVSAQ